MVATIMKYRALISLLFMLYACGAGATVYLFSGNDAYNPGLSYPGYGSPLSLTSFVADNNTTRVSPVFLTATIFRPEFRFLGSVNRSNYYHPILPKWDQFNFYLPLPGMGEFFGNYDTGAPAAKGFLREDYRPAASNYDTPAIRQFVQQDGYYAGVEEHDDPTRMGLKGFLNDDEPPDRPLL